MDCVRLARPWRPLNKQDVLSGHGGDASERLLLTMVEFGLVLSQKALKAFLLAVTGLVVAEDLGIQNLGAGLEELAALDGSKLTHRRLQ